MKDNSDIQNNIKIEYRTLQHDNPPYIKVNIYIIFTIYNSLNLN